VRGLTLNYLGRRILTCFLTIWFGATLIFFIPRLLPGDPIGAMIAQVGQRGGNVGNAASLIASWRHQFGLDQPIQDQYAKYLSSLTRFDFGASFRFYPSEVRDLIFQALPYTIGLLLAATLVAFVLGNLIGALIAWPRTPRLARKLLPLSLPLTSIPYFMLGILLLYIFVFRLAWFPASGAYGEGTTPGFSLAFLLNVIWHGTLPVSSIVLSTMGFWALDMRGMMIATAGEDYTTLGIAKGVRPRRLFWRYGVRNAILPQVTDLTLAIGTIIGGQVLVEILFGYPGVGYLLYQGIINDDFPLINGVVFMLVVATAAAVFCIDLLYPLLDPRISYRR
jgi:peptide/nickel transport system permease protein